MSSDQRKRIAGSLGHAPGGPVLTFVPHRRHTHTSLVNLRQLPRCVDGVQRSGSGWVRTRVPVTDADGWLLPTAIPQVRFVKSARYLPSSPDASWEDEVEIIGRIERNLVEEPLAGFVAEGGVPSGNLVRVMDAALRRAILTREFAASCRPRVTNRRRDRLCTGQGARVPGDLRLALSGLIELVGWDSAQAAGAKIVERSCQFLVRVHHKRAIPGDRFANRQTTHDVHIESRRMAILLTICTYADRITGAEHS
jgi:hypothetical protein